MSRAQYSGTLMPIATSLSPMWPGPSAMMRRSQHSDRQHPPAGQAPRMAAIVTSGERYSRARNWFDSTQKSRYLRSSRGRSQAATSCPLLATLLPNPLGRPTPAKRRAAR